MTVADSPRQRQNLGPFRAITRRRPLQIVLDKGKISDHFGQSVGYPKVIAVCALVVGGVEMFVGLNVARGVYCDVVVGVILVHFCAVHMGSTAVAMIVKDGQHFVVPAAMTLHEVSFMFQIAFVIVHLITALVVNR
jgi:hypothetical protein